MLNKNNKGQKQPLQAKTTKKPEQFAQKRPLDKAPLHKSGNPSKGGLNDSNW